MKLLILLPAFLLLLTPAAFAEDQNLSSILQGGKLTESQAPSPGLQIKDDDTLTIQRAHAAPAFETPIVQDTRSIAPSESDTQAPVEQNNDSN